MDEVVADGDIAAGIGLGQVNGLAAAGDACQLKAFGGCLGALGGQVNVVVFDQAVPQSTALAGKIPGLDAVDVSVVDIVAHRGVVSSRSVSDIMAGVVANGLVVAKCPDTVGIPASGLLGKAAIVAFDEVVRPGDVDAGVVGSLDPVVSDGDVMGGRLVVEGDPAVGYRGEVMDVVVLNGVVLALDGDAPASDFEPSQGDVVGRKSNAALDQAGTAADQAEGFIDRDSLGVGAAADLAGGAGAGSIHAARLDALSRRHQDQAG